MPSGRRTHRKLKKILVWMDLYRLREGCWPKRDPGGSSLPQLLAQKRGVRNHMALPP
jgi:hypothetical protein